MEELTRHWILRVVVAIAATITTAVILSAYIGERAKRQTIEMELQALHDELESRTMEHVHRSNENDRLRRIEGAFEANSLAFLELELDE